MQSKARNIFSIAVHVVVYIAFFAVQFFFNFDIASHGKTAAAGFLNKSAVKNQQAAVTKSAGHSSQKASFRLNKRFHPKHISACNELASTTPLHYVVVIELISYTAQFIPAPIGFIHALRGPPVVV